MKNERKFWGLLILSSLTILIVVFSFWELIEKNYFRDIDYATLHYLYITRGIAVSILITGWAVYFIWREKLRYKKNLYTIIENSTDAIIVYDDGGFIKTFNRAAATITGTADLNSHIFWEFIPLEKQETFRKTIDYVRNGNSVKNFETEINTSGNPVPVSLGIAYLPEERLFIITARDITESLEMRHKIIEMEKSHLFAKVAEGFTHHMGTPLASILLRTQMLKEDVSEIKGNEHFLNTLGSVEKQISYCKKILEKLLKIAEKPVYQKSPHSIKSLVNESIDMTRSIIPLNSVDIELKLPENDSINVNRDIMTFVFSDLFINAVESIQEYGKVMISAGRTDLYQEIEISDNGEGISEENISRVFEPFFTTKPAGKGTGLGLSLARRIIEDHGGNINISSVKNAGTTVRIRLPLS